MKEKKFKDLVGFEDKNTFFIEDQFETQSLPGAKNRYVYDYSFPIIPGEEIGSIFNQTNPLYKEFTTAENLSAYGTDSTLPYLYHNQPGNATRFLTTNGYVNILKEGLVDQDEDVTWSNFEKTVNEDEATFKFNEDCIGFINQVDTFGTFDVAKASEHVDYFRSGYVEFSIKTNKQNCIIASGSTEIGIKDLVTPWLVFGTTVEEGVDVTSLFIGDTKTGSVPVAENYPYYQANSPDGALVNLNIAIKNGKLSIEYSDEYNRNDVNFNFIGNEIISDDQWHHIVVNFGRPGLIKENGTKFNKKFIEIWVDGKLDKRFDDKVNEYKIFYPTLKILFNNIKNTVLEIVNNELDVETNEDYRPTGVYRESGAMPNGYYIGFNDLLHSDKIHKRALQNENNKKLAFAGAIHTFAHGINIPISQYEVKKRFRLWKKETKKFHKTLNLTAEMVEPTVSTNKKKALKLFWNNLLSDTKNGIELDNNYQVESYSVTHKTLNSLTELFNYDMVNNKKINVLKNVRAAFTDNVLVLGPGKVWFPNTEDAAANLDGLKGQGQWNPKDNSTFDSVRSLDLSHVNFYVGPRTDLPMSGLNLINGDRILLTGQIKTEENGIWIYNGLNNYLTRDTDSLITDNSVLNVVFVSDGYYKNTYWKLNSAIESFSDFQKWTVLNTDNVNEILVSPEYSSRWKDYRGENRFINLEEDVDISKYDLIVFMNYPEFSDEITENFPSDSKSFAMKQYDLFIKSLENVVANGANLFISSPKLALDMGIISDYEYIDQKFDNGDAQSAEISPFEINEDADQYFDTHRINQYHVSAEIPGLTDKPTYILTDFINYIPSDVNKNEEYHAKYEYRQFGLEEGNEFIIPSLILRKITDNPDIPGYSSNRKGSKPIVSVEPEHVNTGTVVTKFNNTYYQGSTVTTNQNDDNVSTLIVHNGQLLNGQPINGKIFVNFVEDSYTMSREDYNKATIQVIPVDDPNETVQTRAWQYSTTRLNRKPRKANIRALTEFGQTTPTNGGGGPLIQAPTNSSNGIIRSESDSTNIDYQSDLYNSIDEEIYEIQEIPVLSMTWLGLQWLAE